MLSSSVLPMVYLHSKHVSSRSAAKQADLQLST